MTTIHEALVMALEHHREGRLQQAEHLYRQVLKADARNPDALNLMGVIAQQVGKPDVAIAFFTEAIRVRSDIPLFHFNLGEAYRLAGKHREAIDAYQQATRMQPAYSDAHNALGTLYRTLGFPAEAQACFAEGFRGQGKTSEAVAAYREALRMKPDLTTARNNLGVVHQGRGELDEALACFEHAIVHGNDDPFAHYNRARLWLSQGKFAEGWAEFEWRWRLGQIQKPDKPGPEWDGAPLDGRTLLVYAEQGLGDTLEFIRYLRLFDERQRVYLEVQPALIPLLSASGWTNLVPHGDPSPPYDVHVPLLTLPRLFRTTVDTVPSSVPYLAADPRLTDEWRRELSALDGFKIAIHWQGNPESSMEPWRSIPLAAFEPLAAGPGVHLVSLQKNFGIGQIPELAGRLSVLDLADRLDEAHGAFMDSAAVIAATDLVVTSDSAIAHLAGAMGAPVWLVLPLAVDWRWMLDRADTPWYPTMRLFRQKQLGDWASVFREIAAELAEVVEQSKHSA